MDAVALALPVLIALITVALAFDFLNGLHDAANSIATIVSTRVLRPQHAVIWAAFFNFVAFLIFGAHVAETVGTGIIAAEIAAAAAQGAEGMKAMGKVVAAVRAQAGPTADGAKIAALVKSALNP